MIIFAFKNTVAEKVVQQFDSKLVYLIESEKSKIESFVNLLLTMQPKNVLGLGQYSGRDQNQIRVELMCTNKFRNQLIGPEFEQLVIKPNIKMSSDMKRANTGMGNSYCNLIAYLIQKQINKGELKTQFTFLHIPKKLSFMPELC